METLGGLVDRLTVLNLKLWFVQEKVFAASKVGEGLDAETTGKLASLNLDRNRTMTALDKLFADGLATGKTNVDPRPKSA